MSAMRKDEIELRGERFLTLTAVATCYSVEVSWVREAYDCGLLGEGETVGEEVAIPVRMLARVAEVRRLQLQLGMNFEGIAFLLS